MMKKLTFLTFLCALLTVPLLYSQTHSLSAGYDNGQSQVVQELSNPVYSAQSNLVTTLSHNTTNNMTIGLACNNGVVSFDTSLYRAFDLAGNYGIVQDYNVIAVEFATYYFGGTGPNPITVNVYSTPTGSFPGGVLTLQGTTTVTVSNLDNLVLQTVPVTATIPAGETMVYEIALLGDGVNWHTFLGNNDPQTGPTYWMSPACGQTVIADFGGTFSAVMNVIGEEATPPPTSGFTFCSTETPLAIDPPISISTPAAVADTGSPADTGLIGTALGEYAIGSVNLNIESGWASDLTITLQSPSGTTLLLSGGNGGSNGLTLPSNLVFTDASANDVTTWTSGSPMADYMPQGGTFASTFASESINGDWYIIVNDAGFNDGGSLNSYCITFDRSVGTPPEIFCPADFTADNDAGVCGAVVNFAAPVAIDAEDGVLPAANVVQTGGIPTGGFFPVGDNVVTFTATDSHLNETSCSFTITVLDAEDPVAVCQDVTVVLDAMGNGSIVAADLDGGSTDNCAVDSMSASQTAFSCGDVGTLTVTLTVFDVAGNFSTCDATVTVVDDIAPMIGCIGEPEAITVSHNTDNIITGANTVACQPTADNKFGRHFVLADFGITGEFAISSGEFGVTSADVAFDATVNIWDVSAGFPAGYPGTATLLGSQIVNVPLGSDGSIINYTFATPVVVPAGTVAILVEVTNPNGVVTFFMGGTAGETDDSWLASDACGLSNYGTTSSIGFPDAHYYITVTGASTSTAVTPLEVALDADGMASVPAGDLIMSVDEACGYTVTVGSGGGATPTTLSTPLIGGNGNFGNMFDITATNEVTISSFDVHGDVGITFDVNVWAKSGTHVGSEDNIGDWTLLGTAVGIVSNGDGATTPLGLDLGYTIPAGETHAFFVSPIGGGFNYHNGTAVGTSLASDGNIEIFEGSAKADDFTGTTFAPRVFEGNIIYTVGAGGSSGGTLDLDCSNLGENIVEVFVTDNSGNTSSCLATVVVVDTIAPVLVCGPGDGAVSASEAFEGSSLPAGWSTDVSVGAWDWTFGSGVMSGGAGDFPTNAAIFDDDAAGSGNVNAASLLSPVYDMTGAATATVSFDYALDELGAGETLTAEVWDGAAWQVVLLVDADTAPTNTGAIDVAAYANANFQVRFTYDDAGSWGWSAGVDNFQLDYAVPPVSSDVVIELGADGTTTLDPMDFLSVATDNCGIDVLIADLTEVSCADVGAPILVTIFATDASGNVSSCTQEITVVDAMAPVISCPANEDVELDANGTHTLGDYIASGAATVTDNCTDPVTIFTQDPVAGTLLGFGIHTITFTAEDEYGNVSTCSFELNLTEYLSNNDNELGAAVSMYPNPARNLVTITNSSNILLDNAMIYDINGKLISQINLQDMQAEKVIDVSEFATGVYMVQISGEQASVVKRLIKE